MSNDILRKIVEDMPTPALTTEEGTVWVPIDTIQTVVARAQAEAYERALKYMRETMARSGGFHQTDMGA